MDRISGLAWYVLSGRIYVARYVLSCRICGNISGNRILDIIWPNIYCQAGYYLAKILLSGRICGHISGNRILDIMPNIRCQAGYYLAKISLSGRICGHISGIRLDIWQHILHQEIAYICFFLYIYLILLSIRVVNTCLSWFLLSMFDQVQVIISGSRN